MIRHHKDGNKYNNSPNNIEILKDQREHLNKHCSIKINWESKINELVNSNLVIKSKTMSDILDPLFTSAQKYIIFRKMYGLPLNKTDREVYSRYIKKKLSAIANSDLNRMAQSIIYSV